GVEISTVYEKKELHILGYFVPLDSKPLNDGLEVLRAGRHNRLPKMIQKLNDLGMDVTLDELYEDLEGVDSPGRPHVAQLLIKKGYVKTTLEAFEKYLASDKPAFVEKARMDTIEAVTLLRSVKAVPIMAHPLTVKLDNLRSFIDDLIDVGLLGVEVEYDYKFMGMDRSSDEVREAIKDLEIVRTGGSDYHGTVHYTGLGSVTVSTGIIDELQRIHSEL
ncbi:MAG: PHP domain-containing protein, partial [Candidatus Thorarchaeota archaeon]